MVIRLITRLNPYPMTKSLRLLSCFFLSGLFFSQELNAQSAADAAVRLTATVQNNPPQISLSWPTNTTTSQYQLYRKLKSAGSWGSALASLSGSVTQYTDLTAVAGQNYEYRMIRAGSGYTGYGYINSGIGVPETEYRGKLILLVDTTFSNSLATEIKRLVRDMEGDGWTVLRRDVARNTAVDSVKALIVSLYNLDPSETHCLFLLGRIPVPYSGNINPDGHPDHLGAWPADVYYGDMNGNWTDATVNSTAATQSRHHNIPGDGKFDNSVVPGDVELQVGRVDFFNLPLFPLSEIQLMKNYLDKDHEYRKKIHVPLKRAVIDDNFGYFSGEAFAASAHKNFAPLVGTSSVVSADYFSTMTGNSYQWSYGCGGGSYTSAGGIGSTASFTASNLQGVFTMLFGSYFGDWDSQNNFLRAPLAQGRMLTNLWSGRPHYVLHHMGLGESIGYSLRLTQNNPGGLYFASSVGISGKWIHNALMGDPTLRNDVVAPVSNVIATINGNHCQVNWSSSPDTSVLGYHLYMRNDSITSYARVNPSLITGNSYTDSCLVVKGVHEYMVRALKLEQVPSGSYYNLSEGISDTAYHSFDLSALALFTQTVQGVTVSFNATSTLNPAYQWNFGNGQSSTAPNPTTTYSSNGSFTVQLIATHPCKSDTAYSVVNITEVGLSEFGFAANVEVFPNPGKGLLQISTTKELPVSARVYNTEGRLVYSLDYPKGLSEIDLRELPRGIYLLNLQGDDNNAVKKIILE